MASDICLPRTKVVSAGLVTYKKIPFNILTMTLDMH